MRKRVTFLWPPSLCMPRHCAEEDVECILHV